jgi:polyisoprenoid-binding protein YceI
MKRSFALLVVPVLVLATGCDDPKKPDDTAATLTKAAASNASAAAVTSAAPSAAASASAAAATADAPPAGATRFVVEMGKGMFLIDAPLEKIKGSSDETRGHMDVDPKDIGKARGEIGVRLSTLKTSTFGDMDKDVAQTEHARNWMEVGNDSSAASRMKYEWATLAVSSIEATPAAIADAKDDKGARSIKAKATGDLTLHGVTSKKVVPVTVTFKGPADAPTEITIKTDEAMPVSLKEHDVKPRDQVGGFLNGALERIGKKIDDKVQVSFEATLKATMPAHP